MHEGILNKKSGYEAGGGKKAKEILRPTADMTPAEKPRERGKAYLEELKHSRLPRLTPQEIEAHKQFLARRKGLENRP